MGDYLSGLWTVLEEYDVLAAFWVNIQLTFWAGLLALALGTLLAIMRISPIASLRFVGTAYVNILRNTPLTIIMTFMILALVFQLALQLAGDLTASYFRFAILGLAIYHASFVCEAIRSGVNTVPLGQAEAARAIGLPFMDSARLVILPQAFRGAVAPLGSVLIALMKNSTVAAAASVTTETASTMKVAIEFNPNYLMEIFGVFAIGWVLLVIPVGVLTTWLSERLAVKR
ncbi:ABC transporter permease subunit [Myceligenerans xiligouense]|uniref:Amino acid ABC transporter membrane protein 1 (PAAT family) n=1 Tax=Myceligenerans xiligouense TaxID=253184 RepID=A0A3N4YPM7_9MICO|nr:ABC transporter permease subunit [Myceligenerans xiligouense]RPF22087.1 amino acid ABC transporter membrane protein 1 (PAAT family) [Myceligenerans xiligouense]